MEGISGLVDREQLLVGGRFYEASRSLMMADLRAVLEALEENGQVGRIIVNDSHDGMLNLSWQDLPPKVELISGGTKPGSMNAGVDEADFALFVGYHAMAGTKQAIMDHTYSAEIRHVSINQRFMGETGINAAYAGSQEVPVIFVSGDRAVADEAVALMPWVETAVVKEAQSRRSAWLVPLEAAHTRLRTKAADALAKYFRGQVEPFLVKYPLRLEVDLMTSDMADRAMFCPYMERVSGTRVAQTFESMPECFRGFYTVMALAAGRPIY